MGENWRRTGTVLAAVQLDDGRLLVQAVMNNDMEADSVFRVRDDANTLSIEPLPYSLQERCCIARWRCAYRAYLSRRSGKAKPPPDEKLHLPHVQINRQKVAHAAAQHEAVPDSMVVRNALADVKNDAERIHHAA